MSETFLLNMMRMTYDLARAERAFAVDTQMTVLGTLNMRPEEIDPPYFRSVQKALNEGKPLITDNYTMALDPTMAPKTNQSFPKLRFVLILPIGSYGAICMDQSLKTGVTTKDQLDRLVDFIQQVIHNHQTDMDEEGLMELYNSL
jgi:hypothetical protein